MTSRLDEQLSRYGTYLDTQLVEVEPEQAIDRVTSRSSRPLAENAATPTWRRGLVVALGTAAAVLALVTAFFLFAGPFGGEEPLPPATQPVPGDLEPMELVPTGAHLLTEPSTYQFVVRDPAGLVWLSGYEGQVARLDPGTGETQVWTIRDDTTFGPGVQGLVPARYGGVWMLLGDNSLRWFDGERFRTAVEAPAMVSNQDDLGSVVETADGSLLASTAQGGVFRWDGSSWNRIDEARPAAGAGALAMDGEGTLWVGNDDVGGIWRFDGSKWESFSAEDAAVLAGPVRTIEPLPDGTVWVTTERGVARFDGGSWSAWMSPDIGLRGDIAAALAPDGVVWVAGGSESSGAVGVASFDGNRWSVYGQADGLPEEASWAIAVPVATEDGVFVATGVGLYRLVDDRWTRTLPVEEQAVPAEPPAALAGVRQVQAAGGFLWAWGENEIWRYGDGAWQFYAPLSAAPWDIAYDGRTLWALNEGLAYLEGDEWHRLAAAPAEVWRINADPNTGVLWLSTGEELFRWDGEEMSNYPPLPDGDGYGYVGEIAVSADGRVWAAGLYGYIPSLGGLAVYDDRSDSWEMIRPWRGDEDMPAWALAPTSDGGLWVMFSEWPEDSAEQTEASPGWALGYHNGVTGDWTIFDRDLPGGQPLAMVATDDSVWVAQGGGSVEGSEPIEGVFRFDGETWTHYLSDEVLAVAAAPDGTVWYVTSTGVLHQIEQ